MIIAEDDLIFEVCVTMTTAPANAVLATPVDVTLSTMIGTGTEAYTNKHVSHL